jgi:branched-chain amino acid transport system substrate-binding protein
VFAALLLAAACSDDDEAAVPASTATTDDGGAEADADVVTDYLDYTGGEAGAADASATPIGLGWVNTQGGTNEFPEATAGAEAAVRYINAELGGIGGHPLELHTCFVASAEEEGQACGQQLLNDDDVSTIVFGALFIGNDALHAVVDGAKPIISGVSSHPADSVADNTYILYGDQTHVLGPYGTYARDELGAETAAVVFPSQAGANTAASATRDGLEAAGIEVTSVGYEPQATDLLGPLTAAGGQDADLIVAMTDVAGCVNLATALEQIGSTTPVLATPLCLSPVVAEGLGDLPVGWTFGLAGTLASDTSAPDAVAYVEAATRNGLDEADVPKPFATIGWELVLTAARLMNQAGADDITPATMAEQLVAFDGPLILGPPSLDCGAYDDAPAVCNDQTRFYTYDGEGAFTAASGWVSPP